MHSLKQKLSITHADAGVLYIDESSQLQGELNHAASLRTTGHDASCLNSTSTVRPGIFAVKQKTRTFKYYYDSENKSKYIKD